MGNREMQRYELVERIAVGGMAEVFRAKTYGIHGFEKELAVKRILPEYASNRSFVDRFINEAKIAVTLTHANIVQVMDFSRFGDSLYIAMEFVEGIDLAALLKESRIKGEAISLAAGLHIAIEIFKGLEFAHKRGVVHRDVSPANVLLSTSGEVKIADFGIAQAAEGGSGHTKPNQIMGKWRYMSPEQSRGMSMDSSSDIFSACALLFNVFCGRRLFHQESPAAIIAAIREAPLPRASDILPSLPPMLDRILGRGLTRNPEERSTAAQLGRMLVELSYELRLPVTSGDLADIVSGQINPAAGDDIGSDPSVSDNLIDEIISSELVGRRPKFHTRLTRLTPVGASSPELSVEEESGTVDFGEEVTSLTFVDGGTDEHGMTQWKLGTLAGELIPGFQNYSNSIDQASSWDGETEMSATRRLPSIAEVPERAELANQVMVPVTLPEAMMPLTAPSQPLAQHAQLRERTALAVPHGRGKAARRGTLRLWIAAVLSLIVILSLVLVLASNKSSAPESQTLMSRQITQEPEVPAESEFGNTLDAGAIHLSNFADATVNTLDAMKERDASGEASAEMILLDSTPQGAEIWIESQKIGLTTPAFFSKAELGNKRVEMRLWGYKSCTPGQTGGSQSANLDINCRLEQQISTLSVQTDPSGATVTLAGKIVGETPLEKALPSQRRKVRLEINLEGYRKHSESIHLLPKGELSIVETLKEKTKKGSIDLFVKPWANVYLKGRKIAEAPVRGLRLPYGKHRLRLENPVSKKSKTVTVEVPSSKAYSFRL